MEKKTTVAIVGAGISGLTLAYQLQKRGIDVLVLERTGKPGGMISTYRNDGFTIEEGAQTILEGSDTIWSIIDELQIRRDVLTAHPRGKKRYLLRNGTLVQAPTNFSSLLTTRVISFRAKMQLLRELTYRRKRVGEETVAEFVEDRFGREWLDYVFDPVVASICAGIPERLSMEAIFPELVRYERTYGSVTLGVVLNELTRKKQSKYRTSKISFTGGLSTVPFALSRVLGDRVLYNTEVVALERSHCSGCEQFRLTTKSSNCKTITTQCVVLATPAYEAARLIETFCTSGAKILRSIHHPPLISLYFAFRREAVGIPFNGFGFLVPSVEQCSVLGSIWSSSLYPHHVPPGYIGFTAFVGGERNPELTTLEDGALQEQVLHDVKNIMHISGKPVYLHITRWKQALPQYERGHGQRVGQLREIEREYGGLYFVGNYIKGSSIGECMNTASSLASTIENDMHEFSNRKG